MFTSEMLLFWHPQASPSRRGKNRVPRIQNLSLLMGPHLLQVSDQLFICLCSTGLLPVWTFSHFSIGHKVPFTVTSAVVYPRVARRPVVILQSSFPLKYCYYLRISYKELPLKVLDLGREKQAQDFCGGLRLYS